MIKKCQELMRHTIEKANRQLALNRAAQHELEKDTGDKYSALGLDATCHTLRYYRKGWWGPGRHLSHTRVLREGGGGPTWIPGCA